MHKTENVRICRMMQESGDSKGGTFLNRKNLLETINDDVEVSNFELTRCWLTSFTVIGK